MIVYMILLISTITESQNMACHILRVSIFVCWAVNLKAYISIEPVIEQAWLLYLLSGSGGSA